MFLMPEGQVCFWNFSFLESGPYIFRQGSRNLKKQSVFKAIAVSTNYMLTFSQKRENRPCSFFKQTGEIPLQTQNLKINIDQICTLETHELINVNPVGGGGGVRARGGDLTNFKNFLSNFPGWETKGQSKVSKKPPPQGKKSKQTIL